MKQYALIIVVGMSSQLFSSDSGLRRTPSGLSGTVVAYQSEEIDWKTEPNGGWRNALICRAAFGEPCAHCAQMSPSERAEWQQKFQKIESTHCDPHNLSQ